MIQEKTQRTLGHVKTLASGLLLAALIGLMLGASPAHAGQTFEVNNTGDPLPGDPNFGVCNVNFCTLRTAIVVANNNPGEDTIEFNIPRADQRSINPVDELPKVTEAVTIDGYSQIFSRPNTKPVGSDANLQVHLHGSQAGSAEGLTIEANGVTVRGLIIDGFEGSGIVINGSGNRIEGNFIGTSRFGSSAPTGNGDDGIDVAGGQGNTIGGNTPAARNVISGNAGNGVSMFGTGQSGTVIMGNYIGTDKFGTGDLGNGFAGVAISDSAGNTIGRGEAGANLIAFNGTDGVAVRDFSSSVPDSGNSIRSNSIFSNGDLGIDPSLGFNGGPTANDPLDPDVGPNDLQNKPNLTSAVTSGGRTTVKGRLNSTPNQTFLIEFFSSAPGTDEGKKLLGEKQVTTSSDGKVSFTFGPQTTVAVGRTVTATATGSVRNTSEFSAPRVVADS